ncbi:MAG: four helix bundle protein [Gammaproteobacteria bacterium]|nr:four helix bundle protein [Gammaproteobacteria bacterium]
MGRDLMPHEKLRTWSEAKALSVAVYQTTARFPKEERFGLTNQVRRASVSVMSNLAEGCGRVGARDQAHFSQLAFSSLLELDAQLQLALDLDFLHRTNYLKLRDPVIALAKQISALRTAQLRRVKQ